MKGRLLRHGQAVAIWLSVVAGFGVEGRLSCFGNITAFTAGKKHLLFLTLKPNAEFKLPITPLNTSELPIRESITSFPSFNGHR